MIGRDEVLWAFGTLAAWFTLGVAIVVATAWGYLRGRR